jgi:CheY-like chemotaxis protein
VAIDNAILFAEVQEEKRQHQEAHKKMERLAEAAESASQAKSLFLANMSHEIRTPLGAILGFTDLLNDAELTPAEREKYRSIIDRNGRQLIQLIDDILDLSKVEAGHLDIENLEMSLVTLLNDLESILKFRASEKGLTFEVIREDSAPDTVCTDPTRLRQILMNIVGNAIKFTESGGVRVLVSASGENQRNLQFVVEDTGLGISKDNQARLFEWFTQADSSTTRKFGGTGLGLALSRRLARALGGDIRLESSGQTGSRFLISIINRNLPGECGITEAPKKKNNYEHLKEDLKGVRVLLVEDSADNRMLVESVLSRQGVLVTTAENGREGVDKALTGEFDLVLMDIQMPVLDGIQATAELRKAGYQKPIVALTAHAMKEEREKTLGVGCNAHLTKPLVVSKLLNVIVEFTSRRLAP